ncbi:AAA family ATPase [Pandoraea morbifera]|uniref:AAA family ATPase n=1 Tax=Pandoraea morbifera TaxID=2508300 RepID=A0A5E4S469_9BURK|nr:AAA family ATPase [Pandoraea morbifera]VVD69502.1 AAA family ATPase [Pandoraea morbifera]
MMCIDFMTMKDGEYHEMQFEYNQTAIKLAIKEAFPDDVEPDLGDPKYRHIIENNPFTAALMGTLSQTLGLKDQYFSLDVWQDITNGYVPASFVSDAAMQANDFEVLDTPRGKMIALTKNVSSINEDGTYKKPEKDRAIGTEFVFGMGENFSNTVARLASEDPQVLTDIRNEAMRVFEEHIIPAMLEDAQIRTGTNGVNIQGAREIFAACFMHIENRGTETSEPAPYVHFHLDLMNTALGNDGKLYALYAGDICAKKDEYTALFQRHFMPVLENKFGFEFAPVYLEEDKHNEYLTDEQRNICSYDLPDSWIPENVREHFGQRRQEILDAAGGLGADARELQRFSQREDKTDFSPKALFALWKTKMDAFGFTVESIKKRLNFNQTKPNTKSISDEQLADNFVRKHQEQQIAKRGQVLYISPEPITKEDAAAGITDPHVKALLSTVLDPKSIAAKIEQDKADQALVDKFMRKHKEVCFTESQFRAHIIKQLLHTHDPELAEREAARIFEKECLQMLSKEKSAEFEGFLAGSIENPHEERQAQIRYLREVRFTTRRVLQQEREIFEGFKSRENDAHFAFSENEAKDMVLAYEARMSALMGKEVKLSEGQRRAMMMSLSKNGAHAAILGRAGSGKSFALRGIKEAYEARGFQVIATAPTNKAAHGLGKDALFEEKDVSSLSQLLLDLDLGKRKLTPDMVILADEMGMACLDDYHRLVAHVNAAGAKLISVGEAEQIQSVSHGATFRVLTEHFHAERITEINRQKHAKHREMVENFACGNAKESMYFYYEEGSVSIEKTDNQKTARVAKDYLEDPTSMAQKFIVAGTNKEVEDINNAVREELKRQGKLSDKPEDEITLQDNKGFTRRFQIGDRVLFSKKFNSDDVEQQRVFNSDTGTIIEFKSQLNRLTKKTSIVAMRVQLDNGKQVWVNTNRPQPIKYGYAGTVHKSQGATYVNNYFVPSASLESMHTAYVAMSRHKEHVKVYLSDEMAAELERQEPDGQPTERMLALAERINAKVKGDMPNVESFKHVRAYLNEHANYIETDAKAPPHPLDRFMHVIKRMSQARFKKSTFDFNFIDNTQQHLYAAAKAARRAEIESPAPVVKQPKVKKPVKSKTKTKAAQAQKQMSAEQQQQLRARDKLKEAAVRKKVREQQQQIQTAIDKSKTKETEKQL